MKKYPIIFILFAVLGFAIWGYATSGKEAQTFDGKKVKVVQASEKEFQKVFKSAGVVKGENETDLAFEVPGRITKIYKKEGDYMKRGELLAVIDGNSINAEKNLAQNQLNVSSEVTQKTEEYYDQLIDEAEAALDKAEENYEVAKDSGSESEEKLAKKSVDQAEEAVSSAKKMKDLQWEIAQGEKNVYESKIRVYDANLRKTRLYAPYSGIIISRNFDEGSMVSGSNPVFTVAKSGKKEVEISVPLSVFDQIEVGDEVNVFSENKKVLGEVKTKSPKSNRAEFKSRIVISLSGQSFEFGTFVNVEVPLGEKKDSLAIPMESVRKEYHENVVFTIENEIAKAKFVDLGIVQNGMVEIKSGIKKGDWVVSEGNQYLKNNDKVNYE